MRVICCLRLVVMAVIALAQASCGTKCGIADSVTVLDVHGGIFLVYRVSGVQKKIEFFEAYRGQPNFDSCGFIPSAYNRARTLSAFAGLLEKS